MAKPDLRKILSDNIRKHRELTGISQDEFAHKCGVHRTYIGSVERRERNVTLCTLEFIANAIGVPVPVLLTAGGVR